MRCKEMDDVDKFVDRGSGCIAPVNYTHGLGVDLFALDVAEDHEE